MFEKKPAQLTDENTVDDCVLPVFDIMYPIMHE